jgi:hypothetical protein
LPQALQSLVQHASDGKFQIRVEQTGVEELLAELRVGAKRRDGTIIASTLLLGGIVWMAVGSSLLPGLLLAATGIVGVALARRRL